MSRVFIQCILNVCAVKATTSNCGACITQVRAGIASALAVNIVTSFTLQANSDSAKWCVLESSCITIDTCFITHISNVVASLSFTHWINCILGEIFKFITLHARPSCFITAKTTGTTNGLACETNCCSGVSHCVISGRETSFTLKASSG